MSLHLKVTRALLTRLQARAGSAWGIKSTLAHFLMESIAVESPSFTSFW